MAHPKILDISKAVLVVVDVQEAFRGAIGDFALVASNISIAIRGFRMLDVPVIVTEQYPKGLGRTAEEVLLTLPDDVEFIEKTAFSTYGSEAFNERLKDSGARQVVLCGFETHVCVNQTAHSLLAQAFDVHIMRDCTGSRFEHDKQAGLDKMQASGVIPSSVEMALFELMLDSKHERFKEVQALIK
jgi:nicotinamidase-related amidase